MIVFDLDGTLASSKGKMDSEMAELFSALLKKFKVWVISGGDFPQFEKQLIPSLPQDANLSNLYLGPTCSTKMYLYEGGAWVKKYSLDFTKAEKEYIMKVFYQAIDDLELRPTETWGELVEDRGTQITYSALGQQAPLEAKHTWDPDFEKRKRIRNYLLKDLQWYNILLWGATSIDITRAWVDKAYGVQKLSEISGATLDEMIFVGDAVFPWGNDFPPLDQLGVTSKKISDVEGTKRFIRMLISDTE